MGYGAMHQGSKSRKDCVAKAPCLGGLPGRLTPAKFKLRIFVTGGPLRNESLTEQIARA